MSSCEPCLVSIDRWSIEERIPYCFQKHSKEESEYLSSANSTAMKLLMYCKSRLALTILAFV